MTKKHILTFIMSVCIAGHVVIPMPSAKAEPITLIGGTVFIAGTIFMMVQSGARGTLAPSEKPVELRYSRSCWSPSARTAMLFFEDKNHPGTAIRYILTPGHISSHQEIGVEPITQEGSRIGTRYLLPKGAEMVISANGNSGELKNPTLTNRRATFTCTSEKPTLEEITEWSKARCGD